MLWRLALLLTCAAAALANLNDVLMARKVRPPGCSLGCARWASLAADGSTANQSLVDSHWAAGAAPASAGRHCALQGMLQNAIGQDDSSGSMGGNGGFCYCANASQHNESTASPIPQ